MSTAALAATLRTDDGHRLAARWWHGWAAARDDTAPEAVVLVHGFTGTKDDPTVTRVAERLARGGRSVLSYDSRGHGQSGGLCTLGDLERHDVAAAMATASLEADRVILVGASMGGIAVINHLAGANHAIGAVVVATPARWELPRSTRGVLSALLTQTRAGRYLAARRLGARIAKPSARGRPPIEQLATCHGPVALVHGRDDPFVPARTARALYEVVEGPRYLDIVAGMGHGFGDAAVEPVATAVDWVSSAATDSAARPPDEP